ncbi:MAG: ABC transporter ATP-binding protein [Planctomycetales bacterium]|nr:ABC transporter ATP-binding protein [Planctomycetales bacterium]
MLALTAKGIRKRFGASLAVDGIDLSIAGEERLVILGRSGAGKSTLLRLLAGLETPDQGTLWIDGQEVSGRPPHTRGLALVSQDYALYPQLTVRQNLETALAPLALQRAERQRRIADALAWFGIATLDARLPAELSGGQAQRVALAKAIVRRPRLLLLDEPLSQLDGVLREELREVIRQLAEQYHMSLVMVTHDPLDAMRLGTRVAILEGGRLLQLGPPGEVYAAPRCRLVAELLSPFGVNWLPAHGDVAAGPGLQQALREAWAKGLQVAFRPEDGRCVAGGNDAVGDEESLRLAVELQRLDPLGFTELALLTAADGARLQCLGRWTLEPGAPCWLVVPRQRLLWLG